MKRSEYNALVDKTLEFFEKAHIALTEEEKARVEICHYDLGIPEKVGLEILTLINTDRVCAKELVLFPGQSCAEHRHVPSYGHEGKEETFRCRWGKVYLYVTGEGSRDDIKARIPETDVSVFHEVILEPGDQYTIMPETWHWFQAGDEGAVISEFSTTSTDETDEFTDKRLVRLTETEED